MRQLAQQEGVELPLREFAEREVESEEEAPAALPEESETTSGSKLKWGCGGAAR